MKVKLNFSYILIFILIFDCKIFGQIYTVEGHIFAENEPVANASISFTDNSDTSKIYVCNSDTLGYYKIDILTSIGKLEVVPKNIELHQNYPNPFSRNTSINYSIKRTAETEIRIYDILGREIKRFIFGNQGRGYFGVNWDGTDNNGNIVTSGIYLYVLQNGNERVSKKMIVSTGAKSNYHFGAIQNNSNYVSESIGKTNNSFTVLVQSLEETTPLIVKQIFADQIVDDNTTINFEMEKARILLFKSIDGVKIGDDSLTVIQKLGEPDYIGQSGDCDCYILQYYTGIHQGIDIFLIKGFVFDDMYSVFHISGNEIYSGKSTEGIGIGTNREQVIKELGEAPSDYYSISPIPYGYYKTYMKFIYDSSQNIKVIIMN